MQENTTSNSAPKERRKARQNRSGAHSIGTVSYTHLEEEVAERTSLYTDISLYLETMHAQFITGVADIENDWENFLQTLDAMQLPRLLEIEQAAYDRLMGEE